MRRSLLLPGLILTLTAATCSGSDNPSVSGPAAGSSGGTYAAEVASGDLYVGAPQHFELGVFRGSGGGVQVLTAGTLRFAFSYFGNGGNTTPEAGTQVTATYLPAPGMPKGGGTPTLTDPNTNRGVYLANDVRFPKPGLWQVRVSGDVAGEGPISLTAHFAVNAKPAYPAPGEKALRTENLTIGSKGVPASAIDSRALDGAPIPDPELHRWTIAEAIAQHRPALVIFSTPTYCISRFCGPSTDAVEQLAKRYPTKAVFIHVEIWRDFNNHVINKGAADWLYRNGDLTEPWVYLIGSDGVILDRWGSLMDVPKVAAQLAKLPDMRP